MRPAVWFYILILSIMTIPLHAGETVGMVLMHGKSGTASDKSPVGQLAKYLENHDVMIVTPDMPWHRDRYLEKSYEDSMQEIDRAVEQLKTNGATKIVVGGHSMGANAAMGYGARRKDLAGIVAIAPGHVPDLEAFQVHIGNDWLRARELVNAGKGDELADFNDRNQGSNVEISTTAAIYLSWFQPGGPASMATNVSRQNPDTPLLWIVGDKDRMYDRGKEYAFSSAPAHPANKYIVVKGSHKDSTNKGKQEILNWIKNL